MQEFLFRNNWFEKKYAQNLKLRFWTFKIALNLFLQKGGNLILETGCLRKKDDWDGGCSTLVFGDFCIYFDKRLITVDSNQDNLEIARRETIDYSQVIEYVLQDSLSFLYNYKGAKIDLLYLDSLDDHPEDEILIKKAQEHQLREMQLILPSLSPEAIVLLDDNNVPLGGKTKLTKEFLLSNNFKLLMDFKQSLFYRG